jgi:zinc transport system substrate-binding protein
MILMRGVAVLAALALAAPLRAGCGAEPASSAGRPTVVASFYPLQYVAQRVVGAHAEVVDLTNPGVEPHDLEMSVDETMAVVDATAVLYESGFQPAVDEAVEQNSPRHVVDAAAVVHLRDDNPHFWQDPARMAGVAEAFTRTMSKADPRHADDYRQNLSALLRDLRSLDAAYRSGLAHCALHTVVVSHDAFGYLSKYGLRFVPINGLSPEAEPSPAHIAALQDLIRSDHITTVFTETLASPELADTLAHDLGIRTAVLDPIEGLTRRTADEDYLSLMRANLTHLQEANRCS